MNSLHTDTFRSAMQAHGIVLRDDQLDEDNVEEELWRLQHLTAMARLALRADPGLAIGGAFSPEDLYTALSAVLPIEESTVHTLPELLKYLAVLEQRGEHAPRGLEEPEPPLAPPWADGDVADLRDDGLDAYAEMLALALEASADAQPWRVGVPREDAQRKYLVSTPKRYFRGAAPGVIPDLDQIDFSDVMGEE